MRDVLHCALITDDGYIYPTITAMTSINENLADVSRCVIHLIGIDLAEESLGLLDQLVKKYGNIIVHTMKSDNLFSGLNNSTHVSTSALFKFMLPEIFPDLNEILYLDGDLLVVKDIYQQYQSVDLGDHYVAAVKDMNVMKRYKKPPLERFNAKHNIYFNSGVMFLNLKKIREDSLVEMLVDFKRNYKSSFMDQDAFNFCFNGNVLDLSPVYNYLTFGISSFTSLEINEFYKTKGLFGSSNFHDQVVVYHFASRWKPWRYWLFRYSKMYRYYYQKNIFINKPLKLSYYVSVKIVLLKVMKLVSPFFLSKAFEPGGGRISITKALTAALSLLIKSLLPTAVIILFERNRKRSASKK